VAYLRQKSRVTFRSTKVDTGKLKRKYLKRPWKALAVKLLSNVALLAKQAVSFLSQYLTTAGRTAYLRLDKGGTGIISDCVIEVLTAVLLRIEFFWDVMLLCLGRVFPDVLKDLGALGCVLHACDSSCPLACMDKRVCEWGCPVS
jgi:hypothetical protein